MDAPEKQWVWLARIRRPQGRKGEVLADILTDYPEKFDDRRQLWLLPQDGQKSRGEGFPSSSASVKGAADRSQNPCRQVSLMHHWLHKGGIVLHFEGVNSISDAEKLTNCIVAIPEDQRVNLGSDEAYIGDLIGCRIIDVSRHDDPREVGTIDSVDRSTGPIPLLIVRASEREVLIPFAKAYLRSLDLQNRRVEMNLPDGLIDLNG